MNNFVIALQTARVWMLRPRARRGKHRSTLASLKMPVYRSHVSLVYPHQKAPFYHCWHTRKERIGVFGLVYAYMRSLSPCGTVSYRPLLDNDVGLETVFGRYA